MDPIEKAIRTALEKGDVDDPDFRGRVYRSVEAALDRVIQANPQLTVEKAITRRKQLQQKIAEIETEFAPALPDSGVSLDERLDEALLDILERSTIDGRSGGRHPLPQSAAAAPQPAVAPPATWTRAQEHAAPRVDAPTAPDVQASEEVSSRHYDPRSEPQFASPGTRAADAAGRREPDFSSFDAPARAASASERPDPVIFAEGRFSAAARHAEAPQAARPAAPEPNVDMGVVPQASGPVEPDLDFPEVIPPALDSPDISAPVPESPPEVVAADRVARSREKRRPFAALFLGVALLSLAAAGVMFAFQTGLLKSPQERDTSVHNPSPELESEDFTPSDSGPPALSDQPASQQNWISVFSPSDPATATAPGDARAEVMQDDSGAFLRVRSGASGSAVSFDVGQGVLEQLSGKKAVFNVTARAEDGKETEISIECNFGDLGDCGRKRYTVGYERSEFLFEIAFPDKPPGSSGTIAINSDFSGQGKAIDVYEIRAAGQ